MFRFASRRNHRLYTPLAVFGVLLLANTAASAATSAPVTITADTAKISRADNVSIYTGHVVLTRGGIRLTGSKLVIKQPDDNMFRAVLTGHPATLNRQPTASGAQPIKGHADRVIYTSSDRQLTLHGDAQVSRDDNTIRSEIIRYDLNTKRITAEGTSGGDGRVKITLHPEDNNQP